MCTQMAAQVCVRYQCNRLHRLGSMCRFTIFSATLYILESFWYTSFIQHCTWCNCSYSKNILENIIVWLVVHLYSYDGSMSLFIGHDFSRGSFDPVQLSVYEYAQTEKSVANPDWTINCHEQTQN